MKVLVSTKSGSLYTIDETNKTISGGKLATPTKYKDNGPLRYIQGLPFMLHLENGMIIKTSPIDKVYVSQKEAEVTQDTIPYGAEFVSELEERDR